MSTNEADGAVKLERRGEVISTKTVPLTVE